MRVVSARQNFSAVIIEQMSNKFTVGEVHHKFLNESNCNLYCPINLYFSDIKIWECKIKDNNEVKDKDTKKKRILVEFQPTSPLVLLN